MNRPSLSERVSPFTKVFNRVVLGFPWVMLLITAAVAGYFGYYIKDFKMDASSDSIVLEDDKDLRYYEQTRDIFGSDDYVVVTFTPKGDLFASETQDELHALQNDFEDMEHVDYVTSILNVPLFHSPDVPLFQIAQGYRTLQSEDVNLEMAAQEIVSNPLYKNYLVSMDGETTAMQVTFKPPDPEYQALIDRRSELKIKKIDGELTPAEAAELQRVNKRYIQRHAQGSAERIEDIERIRAIIDQYRDVATIHLGGVPMIMADIINYVEGDIVTLGSGVGIFILLVLAGLFRKVRWIVLPFLACGLPVFIMFGYLGRTDWLATIVSSNFPAILLVITIAMIMHIIVRYRELYAGNPDLSNRELTLHTVRKVAAPCLYTTLTTMVGFASLIVSRIPPVVDFGLMMSMGLGIAYIVCFVFFPAALQYFPKGKPPKRDLAELTESPVRRFATLTEKHGGIITVAAVALFAFCVVGTTRLKVENRFIDYFKEDTEIYQGMTVIDERLGGTTPLEVVLEADSEMYWLEEEGRETMRKVHQWLDELPETGKVISPYTMIQILEKITEGEPVKTPLLKMIVNQIPEDIKEAVVSPYASSDFSQVRIAMRVMESDKSLDRDKLLATMRAGLDEMDLGPAEAHITGVFVLYNNMLQSLFRSQILTIGTVYGAIWIMFLLLFRSWRLATIAIIPNILPVVLVLGTLGWMNIPLDIMTIMIAAITLGIAVDFAIHYIFRFQKEFPVVGSYRETMYRCHNSIGRAMYYTSITIVLGFSILMFSNFIPTVYFGAFTGLAMIVALLASVTLLPLLIIHWRPLGPEEEAASE